MSIVPGKDVGVIIDLGKEDKITSVVIKNRGKQAKQIGLNVSVSTDKATLASDPLDHRGPGLRLEHDDQQAWPLCQDHQGCRSVARTEMGQGPAGRLLQRRRDRPIAI